MIIAPTHMDITLTFLTFDLENDPLLVGEGDCKYDWLDVWDGLPQGMNQQNQYVYTRGNLMKHVHPSTSKLNAFHATCSFPLYNCVFPSCICIFKAIIVLLLHCYCIFRKPA